MKFPRKNYILVQISPNPYTAADTAIHNPGELPRERNFKEFKVMFLFVKRYAIEQMVSKNQICWTTSRLLTRVNLGTLGDLTYMLWFLDAHKKA
ncbi:hypothetical protein SPLC1_S531090 [Arthrospira platensis C1]|uniref:Uncharacterized protein n=2 Tax=Limnospira TaxID=2596745 RepID=A0A9P1NZP0_9CYAN|nr:hypothetical protein AmaxDRAFT_5060 [Limnospira maxima CS-328]EKD06516.1 hypothetical protein SPLC1_S531090 [Arthrospira platensis C1]RAQ40165.1 hypothetical protein B9S53_17360 [Arthrospira sp. O9.13F]UWU48550.1 hypothetical protein APLC1_3348 [Arthrospira platensis C1]CDM95422.1 hypothetical protein ARTHRO_30691 [Limnospira indica PCC 8005]